MGYVVKTLDKRLEGHVFEINGAIALKNYTAEVNENRIRIKSTTNAALSILECEVSEVEIDGQVYTNPVDAQNALNAIVYSDLPIVVLTSEEKKKLILKVEASDPNAQKFIKGDGSYGEVDLEGLATESYVNNQISNIPSVDVSDKLDKGSYSGTAQDLKEEIDNIEIGTRNLVLNSDIEINQSGYLLHTYRMSEDIKDGDLVTITIWGQAANSGNCFMILVGNWYTGIATIYEIKPGMYRGIGRWKQPHTTSGDIRDLLLFNGQGSHSRTGNATVHKIQVERGNKGSDYHPALENIDLAYVSKNNNILYAGTADRPPLIIPRGTLTTVPQDGAIERDANGDFYITKGTNRIKLT